MQDTSHLRRDAMSWQSPQGVDLEGRTIHEYGRPPLPPQNAGMNVYVNPPAPMAMTRGCPSPSEPPLGVAGGLRHGGCPDVPAAVLPKQVSKLILSAEMQVGGSPIGSPNKKYMVRRYKAADDGTGGPKGKIDCLKDAILIRVATTIKQSAQNHKETRKLMKRMQEHISPPQGSRDCGAGGGGYGGGFFDEDAGVHGDPQYGTPGLVKAISEDVTTEIQRLCAGAAGKENDRCAELDGLLQEAYRQVSVLEGIISHRDDEVSRLNGELAAAMEAITTAAVAPPAVAAPREALHPNAMTSDAGTQSEQQETVITTAPTATTATGTVPRTAGRTAAPLGDIRTAPNDFAEPAAAADCRGGTGAGVGIRGVGSVQQALGLLQVSETGEELATLPTGTMVEHLRVVSECRLRLEEMEGRVREAQAVTQEAEARTKDLSQQLQDVGETFRKAARASSSTIGANNTKTGDGTNSANIKSDAAEEPATPHPTTTATATDDAYQQQQDGHHNQQADIAPSHAPRLSPPQPRRNFEATASSEMAPRATVRGVGQPQLQSRERQQQQQSADDAGSTSSLTNDGGGWTEDSGSVKCTDQVNGGPGDENGDAIAALAAVPEGRGPLSTVIEQDEEQEQHQPHGSDDMDIENEKTEEPKPKADRYACQTQGAESIKGNITSNSGNDGGRHAGGRSNVRSDAGRSGTRAWADYDDDWEAEEHGWDRADVAPRGATMEHDGGKWPRGETLPSEATSTSQHQYQKGGINNHKKNARAFSRRHADDEEEDWATTGNTPKRGNGNNSRRTNRVFSTQRNKPKQRRFHQDS